MPKVCLSMIVKDEAHNVEAVFETTKDIIDYYVIVDTSTDSLTIEKIQQYTKNKIPGEVHRRKWTDFSTARNQALELAKASGAKWALIMDADDEIVGNKKIELKEGMTYFIPRKLGTLQWEVPNLIWLADEWKWHYPIHELLVSPAFQGESLKDIWMVCNARAGSRASDPQRTFHDIEFLKELIAQNPQDSRNWFYLASSYATVGDADNALIAYRRRIELGGWNEEIYVSTFMLARIRNLQGAIFDEVLHYLLMAHGFSPERAEPLHGIAYLYRTKIGNYECAYPFAKLAFFKELRKEFLFAETSIYNHGAIHEFMLATYNTGRIDECRMACNKMQERLKGIAEHEKQVIEDYESISSKIKIGDMNKLPDNIWQPKIQAG